MAQLKQHRKREFILFRITQQGGEWVGGHLTQLMSKVGVLLFCEDYIWVILCVCVCVCVLWPERCK